MKCYLSLAIMFIIAINNAYLISSSVSRYKLKSRTLQNFQSLTPLNESGNGSIFYLDRHTLSCPSRSALLGFGLLRASDKIQYGYSCKSSLAISKSQFVSKTTPWNDIDNNEENSANFLDRHTVMCDASMAISKVQLIRNSNKIAYKYDCVKIKALNCLDEKTPESYGGEKHESYYLDRQKIMLPQDRVLTRFTLSTRYDGKAVYYRYAYTSCQLEDIDGKILGIRNIISDLENKAYNIHPKKIEEQDKIIKDKTEENKIKNNRINELNVYINDISSKNQSITKDNEAKKFENTNKTTEKTLAESKATDKSVAINHLRNTVLSKNTDFSNLENKNLDIISDIKKAEDRKANILTQINSIKTEIAEKEKLIASENQEIIKTKSLLAEATKKKEESDLKITALESEINTLIISNDKLKKDNKDAQDLINKNIANIDSSKKAIKTNEKEIARLMKEISDNQALIATATKQRDDTVNSKRAAEIKLANYKKELDTYENF